MSKIVIRTTTRFSQNDMLTLGIKIRDSKLSAKCLGEMKLQNLLFKLWAKHNFIIHLN